MISKFTRFWIENSKITVVFMILTLIIWVFSWIVIPKQYNPDIVVPAYNIIVPAPWFSSEEVRNLIVKPLEDKMWEVQWVEHVYGIANKDYWAVMVSFYVWTDKEKATTRLYNKIFSNINLKPLGVQDPIIKNIDPDEIPIFTIALYWSWYNTSELRKIWLEVLDKLRLVKNVSNIYIIWWDKDTINIILDIDKLKAKNIDIMQVYKVLQDNNVVFPWGDIKIWKTSSSITIDGNLNDIDKIKNLIIYDFDWKPVKIEDVALVYKWLPEKKYFDLINVDWENLENAVFLWFAKKKWTNAVFVVNDLKEKLKEIQKDLPKWIEIQIIQDEWKKAADATNMLLINLIESIVIVFLVLLFYLWFRDAINNSLAIPFTLSLVFFFALVIWDNVNRITLFALILVLWMLVDNSTVVVENVARHLSERTKKGISTLEAVINWTKEVGVWIILATLTRLLAFFSMFFVAWMMGQYMGPIPKYAIVALTVSLFVSLSVNPFISYFFAQRENKKDENKEQQKESRQPKFDVEKIYLNFMRKFIWDEKVYLQRRKWFKRFFWLGLLLIIFVPIFLSIFKARMLPKSNQNQIYLWIDMPRNTNISGSLSVVKDVNKFLNNYYWWKWSWDLAILKNVSWWVGNAPMSDFANLFRWSMARQWSWYISARINLIEKEKRDISSEEFTIKFRPLLRKYILSKYPDAKIRLLEDPPGPPVRATYMLKIQWEDDIPYQDIENLTNWLFKKLKPLLDWNEVVDTYTSVDTYKTNYIIKIDHQLLSKYWLDAKQVAYTVYNIFNWSNISIYHNPNTKEPENIYLTLLPSQKNKLDIFEQIYFTNKKWQKIYLSQFAKIIPNELDRSIYSEDRLKAAYIYGEMWNESVVYPVIATFRVFLDPDFWEWKFAVKSWSPYGFDIVEKSTWREFRIDWWGEWKLTVDTFRDLGLAMIIALILIYFVMVAQFRSFVIGGIIMLTFLLWFFGVFPGFSFLYILKNEYFSATSMIWVIALAWIVVWNAIILIEYLNQLLRNWWTKRVAFLEAWRTRLRPIIITSLTTVLWATTILWDPVWSWLAWSIIWWLSVSAVLTLIVIPIFLYDNISCDYENMTSCEIDELIEKIE